MRRRAVLSGVGAGVASLAGCLGLGGDPQTVQPGASSTATRTEQTPTAEPAALNLAEVQAPETVEVGEPFDVTFVVENTGGEPGVYRTPVGVREIDSVEYAQLTTAEVYVRPGETQEGIVSAPAFDYVREAEFRAEEGATTWAVQVAPRTLSVGGTYALPRRWSGFDLSVAAVGLADQYESADGETTNTAQEGQQYAFALIRATNDNDQGRQFLPDERQFTLETDRGTFSPDGLIYRAPRAYRQQKIRAGETFEGWLGFTVPDSLSRPDLRVNFYQTYTDQRSLSVYWEPS